MRVLGRLLVLGLGAMALGSCGTQLSGTQLERAESKSPEGSEFDVSLYEGYVDLSRSEFGEGDYQDSDTFAIAGLNAAAGNRPAPEEVDSRQQPADKVGELTEARARLVPLLGNQRAIKEYPEDTARAQVMFDCWMQEQEENWQPDDIERCRSSFYDTVAALESALLPKFVLYFDFDKTAITPAGQSVLAEAEAAAKKLGATVSVAGHTDTAGDMTYNEMLSERRAEAVARALADGGVAAKRISTEWHGQTNLAVPTPDGTPKAPNRRVEIYLETR